MYPFGQGQGGLVTLGFFLDFAAMIAAGDLAADVDPSSGDFIALATMPEGSQIHGTFVHVDTALADTLGTGTILATIGDYSSLAGAGTAIDIDGYYGSTPISWKSTGASGTILADAYAAATKVYSTASYLAVSFSGTAVDIISGKVWIMCKATFLTVPDMTIRRPSAWH